VERFYTRGLDKLLDDLDVEVRQKSDKPSPEKAKVTKLHREIAFDEEAIVGLEEKGRQQMVEELMEQFESGELSEPPAESVGESSPEAAEKPEPSAAPSASPAEEQTPETAAEQSDPDSSTTSKQDDDAKKPIAQDDINALFD